MNGQTVRCSADPLALQDRYTHYATNKVAVPLLIERAAIDLLGVMQGFAVLAVEAVSRWRRRLQALRQDGSAAGHRLSATASD